jgi:uncharacterized membrane protein
VQRLSNTTYSRLALLSGLTILTIVILVARGVFSTFPINHFMLINIGLAWIPLLCLLVLWGLTDGKPRSQPLVTAVLLIVWLLFLPNAIYLMTELHHLAGPLEVPLWYDILAVFCVGTTGLLVALQSLFMVTVLLGNYFSRFVRRALVVVSLFLASFGMYIGRFLRANSWDAFIQPVQLLKHISREMFTLGHLGQAMTYSVLYTLFLLFVYAFVYPESLRIDGKSGPGNDAAS